VFKRPSFVPAWVWTIITNWKALIGLAILFAFILLALFADQLAPTDPTRFVGRAQQAPTEEFPLGTTGMGQDVFAQIIHGTGPTLFTGFLAGTMITTIAVIVGLTAGYMGGLVDDILSLFINVALVIPGLPLIIVLSGWVSRPTPLTIAFVLTIIAWAYGARVLRAQALTLRNSEFITAARIVGEPPWRIVLVEILPNMISLVASVWISAVTFAVLTQAALEFIGLGDLNTITWGTMLYWAQNRSALLVGAWWTFIPPGVCLALVGFSLVLINYAIDEITNPRLKRGYVPAFARKTGLLKRLFGHGNNGKDNG